MSVEFFEVVILDTRGAEWLSEDNFTSETRAALWARDHCDGRRWIVRGMRSGHVYATGAAYHTHPEDAVMTTQNAHDEGRAAFHADADLIDNPYAEGGGAWENWRQGWFDESEAWIAKNKARPEITLTTRRPADPDDTKESE